MKQPTGSFGRAAKMTSSHHRNSKKKKMKNETNRSGGRKEKEGEKRVTKDLLQISVKVCVYVHLQMSVET